MRGVSYAAIEIIVLVVLGAIIGFLIGWILRRFLYDVDLGAYEARIAAAERAAREAESRAGDAGAQVASLTADLEAAQTKAAESEEGTASATAELEAAEGRVASLEEALREAETQAAAGAERAASLTSELDAALEVAREKDAAIGRLEAELAGVEVIREESEARAGRIAELEVLVVEKESGDADRIAALEQELRAVRDEHAGCAARLAARDGRIEQLEAVAAAPVTPAPEGTVDRPSKDEAVAAMAEIAARTAGTGSPVDDDLKKIHGVGPKLERLLKRMGITSFAQVARFEADDIATVTAALDAFPGRIERDDWMSSAAEEYEKKYGEPVPTE